MIKFTKGDVDVVKNSYVSLLLNTEIRIPENGLIVGPIHFDDGLGEGNEFDKLENPTDLEVERSKKYGFDNFHFGSGREIYDSGFYGIATKAKESSMKADGVNKIMLEATYEVFKSTCFFAKRHAVKALELSDSCEAKEKDRLLKIAENCYAIYEHEPETFYQAVQTFWFMWRIRGLSSTASIGRLDYNLNKYYEEDLKNGNITRPEALYLVCELFERLNETASGDTLINIMLGGVDNEGNDSTSELSEIMLEAAIKVKNTEPTVNVRFHDKTPENFVKLTLELQLLGQGQGTVYNDKLIIDNLVKYGYSIEDARNYCNDGCTEVMLDAISTIYFVQTNPLKMLELMMFDGEQNPSYKDKEGKYAFKCQQNRRLHTDIEIGYKCGEVTSCETFDDFYNLFLKYAKYYIFSAFDEVFKNISETQDAVVPSLILQGTYTDFLSEGTNMYKNDKIHSIYTAMIGSVATVSDSLYAVKKAVYNKKYCTLGELITALSKDFEGYEELRQCLLNIDKFGNDVEKVDKLAARAAVDFCNIVDEYNMKNNTHFLPALYNYLFVDHAKICAASPDGRKQGDPVAEHYCPTPGNAKLGPTAIMKSVHHGPLDRAVGASPIFVALSRQHVSNTNDGFAILKTLNDTALELGICIFNVAIYDVEELRTAQKNPKGHEDLIVRVWGYSAKFTELSEDMQNHIISRVC